MPLGTDIGISPDHIVLDGDQLPKKGHSNPPLGPMAIVAKRLPISAIAELLRHRDKVERGYTSSNLHLGLSDGIKSVSVCIQTP